MTLLNFENGESFATGAMGYDYRPATKAETTNRILFRNNRRLGRSHPESRLRNALYYNKNPESSYASL